MGFALSDIQIVSTAFEAYGEIPQRHTGEGENVSPELHWSNAPEGTKGFAVICHDPDAPLLKPASYGYVHWLLYNIPATTNELPEGTDQFTSGISDFGRSGYGGPMPPEGHGKHHYYFWILALDSEMDLQANLTMPELLQRIEPHVVGMNRLIGTYMRN